MYCPACNHHKKNRDVSATSYRNCERCGYKFVFFPERTGLKINDRMFTKKIDSLTGKGNYFFTSKQFYYDLNKNYSFRINVFYILAVVAFLFASVVFWGIKSSIFGGIVYFFSFLFAFLGFTQYEKWKISLTKEECQKMLSKWQNEKGEINLLLPEKDLSFNQPEYEDLKDYAFDFLLVTDQNELANFLIKNDFHFRNKAAVVSWNKYPKHLFPYVIDQVKKNPAIPIFIIHDCDLVYASLRDKLKKHWFPETPVKIYDLGLHPSQVLSYRKFITNRRENSTTNITISGYSPKEQRWFKEGYIAELAFLHPVRLLNLLQFVVNYYKDKGENDFRNTIDKAFIQALVVKKVSGKSVEGDIEVDFG